MKINWLNDCEPLSVSVVLFWGFFYVCAYLFISLRPLVEHDYQLLGCPFYTVLNYCWFLNLWHFKLICIFSLGMIKSQKYFDHLNSSITMNLKSCVSSEQALEPFISQIHLHVLSYKCTMFFFLRLYSYHSLKWNSFPHLV